MATSTTSNRELRATRTKRADASINRVRRCFAAGRCRGEKRAIWCADVALLTTPRPDRLFLATSFSRRVVRVGEGYRNG